MAKGTQKRSRFARRAYQPGEDLNAIGAMVQKVRIGLGWSQLELATKCQLRNWDIDRVIVAKIESRIRAVSDWELGLLCRVLGVFPDELLGFREFKFSRTDKKRGRSSPRAK